MLEILQGVMLLIIQRIKGNCLSKQQWFLNNLLKQNVYLQDYNNRIKIRKKGLI